MGQVTALEFVNRIRRRMRAGSDVSNVTDEENAVLLDIVNAAIADVLAGKNWEFDLRHDGILNTLATQTLGSVSVTASTFTTDTSDQFDFATFTAADQHVVRGIIETDGRYSNTAFRITSIEDSGSVQTFRVDGTFPGTVGGGAVSTMKTVAHEFILPASVRAVVSVTHEERPLTLDQVDPTATFDQLVPRPHGTTAHPEWVGVGGFDVPTRDYTASASDPALRMIVWPLPDAAISLRYSYYVDHARLATATDALIGVPDRVIEDIVRIAHGDAVASVEKNAEEGLRIANSALRSSNEKYMNQSAQPRGRHAVGSWSRKPGVTDRISGFPGVTLTK